MQDIIITNGIETAAVAAGRTTIPILIIIAIAAAADPQQRSIKEVGHVERT